MLRTCDKCGKANQDTRKFCIRCGASLIKPLKEKPVPAPTPQPAIEQARATSAVPKPREQSTTVTDDKWVKPSEVSRDRVRMASGHKQKSELEKAREAFAKAETVGIDEADGSGVVESRMLRASEVRELLEGPAMMAGAEEIPAPTMMEGSEPLPPEAEAMMQPSMPTSSQLEESILGSKSVFVEHPTPVEEHIEPPAGEAVVPPEVSTEVSSQKIEQETAEVKTPEVIEETTGFAPHTPPVSQTPSPEKPKREFTPDDVDLVITCPDCGKTITVDMFEYPKEVYSAMASARLKQARFFIVQGKGNEALRIVRMANSLYTKAGDNKGLEEVRKIIEALAKKT